MDDLTKYRNLRAFERMGMLLAADNGARTYTPTTSMTHSFFQPPATSRYALRNLRVPHCLMQAELPGPTGDELVAIDLLIDNGRIATIDRAGAMPAEPRRRRYSQH